MGKQNFRQSLLALVLLSVLSGCMFSRLEQDLERLGGVIHEFAGEVSTDGDETDGFVVLALRDNQGEQIAAFRMIAGPGPFRIRSDPSPLYFFCFDDLNRDLKFQADEPYAWANSGQTIDPSNDETDDIRIAVSMTDNNRLAYPPALIDEPLENHFSDNVRIHIGTVSSLDNPWFSEDQATKGLWQPFQFMEDGGAGIHFLEPYDPDKTPVLFVHGILDSPRTFQPLIERIDPSKYQVWVYSYPSGLRLSFLAGGMYRFLEILHRRHRFDDLHVIAHSMGGLVSRGGINRCSEENICSYLRSYTTISVPWSGVPSAATGVRRAPAVVPVWLDLDPASDYVTTLFDTPMPNEVPYQLLFGFRRSSFFGSDSSDGVISLSSQLRLAAQEQAQLLRGLDEGHISILSNEVVGRLINEFLNQESQ